MNENNSETKQLLIKFEELISLSKDELTKSILEIETNVESRSNYDALRRIHKSVGQYIEKKRELVYIGFMGHFSSGKSSTINSLLNLSGKNAREVDLHPSDKAISLITHPSNEPSFIKLVSYGNIPVKPVYVEHDFLKNIVFIDTPGAGDTDPLIISELMQDYLPICDLLLYFFSSTNPLDENDLPLLKAKEENLSLIPTKFIVTRADEFRKDFDSGISVDNFDESESNRFIAKAIARIKDTIDLVKISDKDFHIIDNKKGFGIPDLVDYVSEYSSLDDVENKIRMHEYKVSLFRNNGLKIRSRFLENTTSKLKTLNKYVDDARNNIARYEDKVRITNNRLTETWRNYQSEIERIKNRNIKDLEEPSLKNVCTTIWGDTLIVELFNKISSNFSSFKSTPVNEFYDEFISKTQDEIRPYLSSVRTEIENVDLNRFQNLKYKIEDFKVTELPQINVTFSTFVESEMNKIETTLLSAVKELLYFLKSNNNSLSHRLLNFQPISLLSDIIRKAQEGLNKDIDVHFDHVYLYRAGVFSEHVKEYISKLGIGHKLNQLESEFKEQFKEQIKQKAADIIFSNYNENTKTFQDSLSKLKYDFEENQITLNSVDLSVVEFDKIETKSTIAESSSNLCNILIDNVNHRLRNKIKSTFHEIEQNIREYQTKFRTKTKTLKRNRWTRFFLFTVIAASIVLPFTIFNYLKLNDDTANNFIISIVANLVLPVISFAIAKLTDTISDKIRDSKQEIKNEMITSSNKILDNSLKEFKDNQDEKTLIDKHFRESLEKQLADIRNQSYSKKLSGIYLELIECHKKDKEIRSVYIEEIKNITRLLSAYFNYDDAKLEVISHDIKQEAIEPSFDFLADLKTQISDVNNKIQEINLV
ncbi:50S ribosome-binding GTPase [Carboxylicivirga mesophila]|uniref:50S ribosome-binding GTPase n=1 Tax=Carboxylicivirga mesophila TaxID=1166478 RepID=A0ABS5KGP6_9BACT|nr:GTPase [Carboxylicivirga mesophila]MBS2213937.1 50S ribosome-binding GTPase [Carboxylicivirga mesophila]